MSGSPHPALSAEAVAGARRAFPVATTLPPDAYAHPDIYEAELQRVFARSWLCAGRVEQIPEPGDYRCLDLLGDKLVLVRDRDGEVRALSRICRHRGAELVQGVGNTRSFACPYHAWTYGLDGRLVGAPLMETRRDFARADCRLPELRSEVWQGFIFVNFDSAAPPLTPDLAPLTRMLAHLGLADLVALETATFPSAFNWKVLTDNFMEAYHHIATHRQSLETMFPASHSRTPDNHGPYAALFMPAAAGTEGLAAINVFPCHLFAPTTDGTAWYQLLPERFDHFTLRIYTCLPRSTVDDPAQRERIETLQELTRAVHREDIGACESVWSGLQARSARPGPLAPLEKPLWQFNQWWLDQLAASR